MAIKRLVLVMGEPGSGKTSLMRDVIAGLGMPGEELANNIGLGGQRLNNARATAYPDTQVLLFGVYDGNLYDGTDRLGRNVQPAASRLLLDVDHNYRYAGWTVLMEGDRLTTRSFLEHAGTICPVVIVRLDVRENILDARRAQRALEDAEWVKTANPLVAGKPRREGRGDGQDSGWLAGRRTKLANIALSWSDSLVTLPHNHVGDRVVARHVVCHLVGACGCTNVPTSILHLGVLV